MLTKNTNINKALQEMGFKSFTEIQEKSIPLLLEGHDVIGHSQTGTGKTAAFALPILERLDYSIKSPQALILCPTRELAVQVTNEIEKMGKYLKELKTVCIFGGDSYDRQLRLLKKNPQIIVGTPGRTVDHLTRNRIDLKHLNFLILDEADEMLKMGFKEELEVILAGTNEVKQTMLFSATMPAFVKKIAESYMDNPRVVSVVDEIKTNTDVEQYIYHVKKDLKTEALMRLLKLYKHSKTLIFCNTKKQVDELTNELNDLGVSVDKIHGDLAQEMRIGILRRFHQNSSNVLIATDVIARGLDIKGVDLVVNYDVPDKAEHYVHRIGRTGRIGNKGVSLTLMYKNEQRKIKFIEDYTNSQMTVKKVPNQQIMNQLHEEEELAEINRLIFNEDINSKIDLATKLIELYDVEDIILALLKSRDNNQLSSFIADVNEDITLKSDRKDRSSRRDRKRRTNGSTVRFHLNVGSSSGTTKEKMLSVISQKTNVKSNDIQDLDIKHSFSFFTVDTRFKSNVLSSIVNEKMFGKTVTVKLAR